MTYCLQREHTANIQDSPQSYSQQSPPKPKNIITLDCRGLEFVEFKADVSPTKLSLFSSRQTPPCALFLMTIRVTGRPQASKAAPSSPALISQKASGSSTTRSPVRRSASRISSLISSGRRKARLLHARTTKPHHTSSEEPQWRITEAVCHFRLSPLLNTMTVPGNARRATS